MKYFVLNSARKCYYLSCAFLFFLLFIYFACSILILVQPRNKQHITQLVNAVVDEPVDFSQLKLGWEGLNIYIKITDIKIHRQGIRIDKIQHIKLLIEPIQSVFYLKPIFKKVVITGGAVEIPVDFSLGAVPSNVNFENLFPAKQVVFENVVFSLKDTHTLQKNLLKSMVVHYGFLSYTKGVYQLYGNVSEDSVFKSAEQSIEMAAEFKLKPTSAKHQNQVLEGRLYTRIGDYFLKKYMPAAFKNIINEEFKGWANFKAGINPQQERFYFELKEFVSEIQQTPVFLKLNIASDFEQEDLKWDAQIETGGLDPEVWLSKIPKLWMKESVSNWLQKSIRTGHVNNIQGTLSGTRFDFKKMDYGVENLLFKIGVQDVDLQYDSDWPAVYHVDADVVFQNTDLKLNLKKGSISGVPIEKLEAEILHLNQAPRVTIHASVNTAIENALGVVLETPLKSDFKDFLQYIDLRGPCALDLQLDIPLEPHDHSVAVSGVVHANKINANILDFGDPISNLTGDIYFNNFNIYSNILKGEFSGRPLSVVIHKEKENQTQIQMEGFLSSDQLIKKAPSYFKNTDTEKILSALHGESPFHLNMTYQNNIKSFNVDFYSSLEGLASNMPMPFYKKASDRFPIKINIHTEKATKTAYNIDLNTGQYRGMFLDQMKTGLSGNIFINEKIIKNKDKKDKKDNLKIYGSLEKLDLDAWADFLDLSHSSHQNEMEKYKKLEISDFDIQKLVFQKKVFSNVNVSLKNNADYVNVDFKSKEISGKFNFYYDHRLLSAEIESYHFDTESKSYTRLTPKDFEDYQSYLITIHRFQYGQLPEVPLSFGLKSLENEIKIENFNLKYPFFSIKTDGTWQFLPDKTQQVSFDGAFEMTDFDAIEKQLGYNTGLDQAQFAGIYHLNAPVGLSDLSWPILAGEIKIQSGQGRIQKIKTGMGRFLGVFNLSSIEKRLKLDFSDLIHDDFSFDTLSAVLNVQQGHLKISDLKIGSTSFNVKALGEVDLLKRTYDLDFFVNPRISRDIPLATVVVAGNPILGAALLLADQLLKKPIVDATVKHYKIQGNWEKPEVVLMPHHLAPAVDFSEEGGWMG
jgi:uncharacterized protein YhdP